MDDVIISFSMREFLVKRENKTQNKKPRENKTKSQVQQHGLGFDFEYVLCPAWVMRSVNENDKRILPPHPLGSSAKKFRIPISFSSKKNMKNMQFKTTFFEEISD